jgi:CMP-N-acetylneuraminic acid synthetase
MIKNCFIFSLNSQNESINPSVTFDLNNQCLLKRCIQTCRESGFENLTLITNCEHSKIIGKEHSIDSFFLKTGSLEDAMHHMALERFFNVSFFINPCFPLINSFDINKSINHFISNKLDSSFAGCSKKDLLFWKDGQPFNFSIEDRHLPNFSKESYVLESEAFYIRTRDSILNHQRRYGGKIKPFILPSEKLISTKHESLFSKIDTAKPQTKNREQQDYERLQKRIF